MKAKDEELIMKYIIKLLALSAGLLLVSTFTVNANALFTLENLERERAALLENLSSGEIALSQREQKNRVIVRRLTDIERMVLRDDRIAASNSVAAKKAFENYDLTFLVHARSESQKSMMAHWLYQMDITNAKVKQSRMGTR